MLEYNEKKSNALFNERRANLFKDNIPTFSVQEQSQCVRLAETSGDNDPKHFRKLYISRVVCYVTNTDI